MISYFGNCISPQDKIPKLIRDSFGRDKGQKLACRMQDESGVELIFREDPRLLVFSRGTDRIIWKAGESNRLIGSTPRAPRGLWLGQMDILR